MALGRVLPGPYEILELADRQSARLRIVTWEQGVMTIHPRNRGGPEEKTIEVLRVHVSPETKPVPPTYYDITSKTLIAQFMPMLMTVGFENYEYVITKFGIAPRARFQLDRVPL